MAKNKRRRTQGPQPDEPQQVGRRPSSPVFLFVVALAWLAVGIVVLVTLSASWKIIPGVVFIGIGVLYLRAALATIVRRSER